jgi:hypothetical protein
MNTNDQQQPYEPGNFTGDRLTPIPTVFQEDINESVELTVQERLVKAGITEEALSELRQNAEQWMKPVHSEKELDELQKNVITPLVKMRTKIERICKKGREEANMIRNAWIANEKTYTGMVRQIEDPLVKYKDDFRAEQERIKKEEEAEAQRQLQARYAALEAVGCIRRAASGIEPERYVIGSVTITLDQINSCDYDTWNNLVRSAEIVAAEEREKKEAEERAAREEQERIQAEQERLRIEAQRLEKEKQELIALRVQSRTDRLLAIGMTTGSDGQLYITHGIIALMNVVPADLGEMSAEGWEELQAEAWRMVEKRLKLIEEAQVWAEQQEQAAARQRKLDNRMKLLTDAGWVYRKDQEPEPDMVLHGLSGNVVLSCIIDGENGLLNVTDQQVQEWVDAGEEVKENILMQKEKEAERQRVIADRVKRLKESGWVTGDKYQDGFFLVDKDGTQVDGWYIGPFEAVMAFTEESMSKAIQRGQAELARREEERQAKLKAEAEEAARKKMEEEAAAKAKEEEDRKAKLSDADKWTEWVALVKQSAPDMLSPIGHHAVKRVMAGLDSMTPGLIADLNK